jgi:tetratricopeptide (TPR) repeat protein
MTAPAPPAEQVPPDPLTTSPATLTARSSELHTIAGHADKAAAGALQVVWITAEAGAGKSTLAAAATAALRAQGWVVALGHCPEVDGAPSAWAWREVLGDDQPASSAGGDSFAVAQAVARKFSSGRTIVVLDDLHRADSATLQILRQVCSWLVDRPVLVLGGYRPSEADVELKGTVTALLAHTAQSIELGGLSDNGIQTVCAQAGLDALDETTLQLIRQRTDGNPLFVRELAKLIVSRGVTEASVTVPAGIVDVIARRMARLPSEAGRLLRLAAVCGQHTNIDTLLGLWGDSEDTLLDAIDTTEVAGLITSDHTGRIGFSHILVRECAYSQIPRLRRARMHWQTLLALESQARPDPDELAHHSALGATPATAGHALRYVRAAAERRLQAGAHADVAPLWQSVVDLEQMAGHASALATSHQRAGHLESLCHLVTALAYAGDLLQARQVRSRALDVAETDGRIDLIHRALTAWRAPTIWSNRDERRADDRMAHTLRRYLPGSDGHARVWLLITTVLEVEGIESAHAYDAAAQALALARDLDDPELLCAALNTQMFMALGPDLVDALPGWTVELEKVAERAGLIAYQAVAHYFRFLIACSHTDLPEAATQVTLALEYASGGQVGQLAVVLSAYTAVLSALAGDLDAAGRGYRELSTRMIAAGLPNGEAMALIGHLILGWHRGSIGHLTEPLAALYPVVPQMITWPYVLALLDAGHHDRAEQVADDAIAVSRDYYWTTMSAFHARALVRLGRVEHARTLYANLAPFSGMVAGLNSGTAVLGPIDDLLADLADLIGEPDAAAHHRARAVDTRTRVEDGLTALTAR